jgi:hypothetical protein
MREEIIRELEIIKKDCLESSDPELNLIGHLLTTIIITTIIISNQKKDLDSLAKIVSKWITKTINGGEDEIPPPSIHYL